MHSPVAESADHPPDETGEHPPIPPLPLRQALQLSFAGIGVGMNFAFFNAQQPLYHDKYNVPAQWIGPTGRLPTPL